MVVGGVVGLIWKSKTKPTAKQNDYGGVLNYLTKIGDELTGEKFKSEKSVKTKSGKKIRHYNATNLLKADINPYIKKKLLKLLVIWSSQNRSFEILGKGKILFDTDIEELAPSTREIETVFKLNGTSIKNFDEIEIKVDEYLEWQEQQRLAQNANSKTKTEIMDIEIDNFGAGKMKNIRQF